MQYDVNPIFYPRWQQYNTCLAAPAVTGKDTTRLNPKLSTSPIARTTNLVGKTKLIIRRDLQRYFNHAYKNSEKNQIFFIDNLDHKPTIYRISTNTPQKELHRIDLQEDRGELCIEIQRERRSHLANNCGPEGLR